MGVDIIDCPSCGKETFNNKFCIFCGKKIETPTNQSIIEVTQNGEGINRFEVNTLREKQKWKSRLESWAIGELL